MNAIFDKDDDCCDQTLEYYAHDPRLKSREHALGSLNYDDRQNYWKKEELESNLTRLDDINLLLQSI